MKKKIIVTDNPQTLSKQEIDGADVVINTAAATGKKLVKNKPGKLKEQDLSHWLTKI